MKENMVPDNKSRIFYPRDYRHLNKPKPRSLLFLGIFVLPTLCLFLFFYPTITISLSSWGAAILRATTKTVVSIESVRFIPGLGEASFISIEGTTPTFTHSLVNAIISVFFILLSTQINRNNRPLMIYLSMGLFVHLVSSLFFLVIPDLFPYTIQDYSRLYILQQIGTWMTITVISGLATNLVLPTGGYKYAAFIVTVLFSFIFGCVRYVIYLYLLYRFTVLYMAALYFIFGVLYDFLGMIAIYAIFVRGASYRMSSNAGKGEWQW